MNEQSFIAEENTAWRDAQLQARIAEILSEAMRWSDDDSEAP